MHIILYNLIYTALYFIRRLLASNSNKRSQKNYPAVHVCRSWRQRHQWPDGDDVEEWKIGRVLV